MATLFNLSTEMLADCILSFCKRHIELTGHNDFDFQFETFYKFDLDETDNSPSCEAGIKEIAKALLKLEKDDKIIIARSMGYFDSDELYKYPSQTSFISFKVAKE